MNNRQLCGLL